MIDCFTMDLPTEKSSCELATRLASQLIAPLSMGFRGEIGTGKTTFIRALLRALGVEASIKSPTFSLVETYPFVNQTIHHFDLYRIHDETELEYIGFRDYFSNDAICCIEWPEKADSALKRLDIEFLLTIKNGGREMQMNALSSFGAKIVTQLAGE